MEIVTDIWFGSNYPGYNWKAQSLSYLGQRGSPVEQWVQLTSILFTILITFFAYSFYQINESNKWAGIAACMLIIYGLGEGLGSGFFPIDLPDAIVTMSSLNVIAGELDGLGLLMASFFLIAKHFHPNNFITSYKGVWQRLYLFNYYIMLGVINWQMARQIMLK